MSNTQENIINALFQLALEYPNRSNFSIAEIANKANISKQAIYQKYFKNTNEILKYLHQTIDNDVFTVLDNYNKSENIDPFIFFSTEVLPIIYKYRNWLKYLYLTALDPNWTIFLKKKYLNWISKNIEVNTHLDIQKSYLDRIIVGNILSIIEAWLSQDIPDHPQKFSKTFLELINMPIHSYIQRI